ncbi:hypothetical protein NEOLEDRAFT_319886 [Neolentinus lepideus HHB14362 ss-1]|uniref:Uncharacterized protein n=1 Tax=Neolentinus lepideus HHB14362 ss-1 TaxID=1314782 RepID=A0A165VUY8_9AGAM|nr:hypothetical protein NEOLEDRAFT_319886 [Neolentinus lepideus HHB14362 ss-1]
MWLTSMLPMHYYAVRLAQTKNRDRSCFLLSLEEMAMQYLFILGPAMNRFLTATHRPTYSSEVRNRVRSCATLSSFRRLRNNASCNHTRRGTTVYSPAADLRTSFQSMVILDLQAPSNQSETKEAMIPGRDCALHAVRPVRSDAMAFDIYYHRVEMRVVILKIAGETQSRPLLI